MHTGVTILKQNINIVTLNCRGKCKFECNYASGESCCRL